MTMATIDSYEQDMILKAQKMASKAQTPIEKLRYQCLQRGAHGILGFGRLFRLMDDSRDKKLNLEELTTGVQDYGLGLSPDEIQTLFNDIDKDGSGSVDFNEFLLSLRPSMPQSRISLIEQAFAKMDRSGDGVVTIEDLKGVYKATSHPKYLNGELTENQVFQLFLKNFDAADNPDGKITKEEFLNYYAGVSASIDLDAYFDLVMRNAWKL